MPTLRIQHPNRTVKVCHLFKRLTLIGSSEECDVVVADSEVNPIHCHLHFDGRTYCLVPLDRASKVFINGKQRRKHTLSHDDLIQVGSTEIRFSIYDEPSSADEAIDTALQVSPYRMLFEFSQKLLGTYRLDALLEEMMDAVVAVSNADKGFLVLFEDETPRVKVARNLNHENVDDAVEQLSDSIVAKVVNTKQPLIVSDALKDDEFANAKSVIHLKLISVMCVPLMDKESLLGLIYVGNNTISHLFDQHSLELLTIFSAQASLIVKNALLIDDLTLKNKHLAQQIDTMRFGRVVGSCNAMREVFKKIEKVATTDVSVLITGETGTGKELIATEIHERSSRRKGPFVSINCGAIPENLLESELFGYVRGAFTGAVANKRGKFQAADGGTLFLDEIGELPTALQVKLLRVLQDRTVVRVGETKPEAIDIRVVAATNRQLQQEIASGRFREDLYYRLNVVELHLPPLRERGDDVVVIATYLLQKFAADFASIVRGFSPDAIVAIKKFPWPGNIRQLENHLKKAIIMADKPILSANDLGLSPESLPTIVSLAQAKEEFQRRYIHEVLALNNGNRTKTAQDLDVDPRTIYRYLEREEFAIEES